MALSYKEFLEKKKKEAEEAKEPSDTSSVDITLDAYKRKKRKGKRPFSQETLVNRLKRK